MRRGLERRKAETIPRLGVDEKSFRKCHRYLTLVNDLDRSRVLYVAEGRRKQSLDGFWETLSAEQSAGVEAVAMDMWDPYVALAQEHLPEADQKLKILVRWNADDVVHSTLFQRLVDLRLGESGVGAKSDLFAFGLLTLDLGQQQFVLIRGAGDVAWPQLRRQSVVVLVEQQQRVIAHRLEVAVVGAALLLAVHRSLGRIHIEHDSLGIVAGFGLGD